MPHQCTSCGRTFADGSKEMLSGCPDCGGNKFQFQPKGATSNAPEAGEEPSTPAPSSNAGASSGSGTSSDPDVSTAADPSTAADETHSPAERSTTAGTPTRNGGGEDSAGGRTDPAGVDSPGDDTEAVDGPSADRRRSTAESAAANDAPKGGEDTAQASARSDVVSPDELDRAAREPAGETASEGASDTEEHRPDIDDLRDELNDQFESIRIVSPGKYELNLMELYDRQEYIISLQEDGRYVIEMPDAWGASDEE